MKDDSRPFRVFSDDSIDFFGATLKQEQKDGSVRPIVYANCTTFGSERHWAPLDLEAGIIVWAVNRF